MEEKNKQTADQEYNFAIKQLKDLIHKCISKGDYQTARNVRRDLTDILGLNKLNINLNIEGKIDSLIDIKNMSSDDLEKEIRKKLQGK